MPQVGYIRDHCIVCVVEIKRSHMTEGKARQRMTEYLIHTAQHPSRDENLRAYLVMADRVVPYRLEVEEGNWVVRQGGAFNMFAAGDQFTRGLGRIAIRYWN